MPAPDKMTIREARAADIAQIIAIGKESPTAAHWFEAEYVRMLEQYLGSHLVSRVALVGESSGGVVGFLVARGVGSDWEIENVVVAPSARRQGIATQLLGELKGLARKQSAANVFLEVRESNHAAIALYISQGFKQAGRRKSYYSNPEEDALLLRLSLDL